MACRAGSDGVFQAPAPRHIVPSGLPTEALIADALVRKYADHTPFYRQAQALRRQGIEIDRGTMCDWAGKAAAWLGRLTSRMKADLLTGARLFVDETTAKVLAPGTGKVKTGYLWTIARDDGAHGGTDPPAVVYTYMPGRGRVWAEKLLGDFTGIVQCDGYGAYKHLEAPDRKAGPGTFAFCWAHVRRGFFDNAKGGNAPVAEEALRRKARWVCEQAHQQLKEELGLDHFEGRSWQGLHRHCLMCMIALPFLQSRRLKQVEGEKRIPGPPPQPSLPAVRRAILNALAQPPPTQCSRCRNIIHPENLPK